MLRAYENKLPISFEALLTFTLLKEKHFSHSYPIRKLKMPLARFDEVEGKTSFFFIVKLQSLRESLQLCAYP